jgi:hypothetical protein
MPFPHFPHPSTFVLSILYKGETMLMKYSFGVTELAKGHMDEEGAHPSTNVDEKPHNTQVQETTADVISPQNREAQREEANKI